MPLRTSSPSVIWGTPRPGMVKPPSDVPVAVKNWTRWRSPGASAITKLPSAAESNAVGLMMRPLSDPIWTIRFGVSSPRANCVNRVRAPIEDQIFTEGERLQAAISSNEAARCGARLPVARRSSSRPAHEVPSGPSRSSDRVEISLGHRQ